MSIRFQADNDLRFSIVRAVRQREPAIDFVSSNEASLDGVGDAEVLEWAARDERVLVSHDRWTMLNHFRSRLAAGKPSAGLLVVSQGAPVGAVVEAIVLLWAVADPMELRDQAYHLPSLVRHSFPR